MALYRACAEMVCSEGETCGCPGATSCVEPSCVSEVVPPEDLERVSNPGMLPADAGIPISDAGSPDGSVPDGGIISCEPPLMLCGMNCVNPQGDPRYCGDCETACPVGYVCETGSCIDPGDCRMNSVGCSGFTCCDEESGNCLPGCEDDDQCVGDNEACDTVLHECVCKLSFHRCGAICVDDLDVNFCGDLCTSCLAPPNATPICDLGTCDFVCDESYAPCGQLCCPTNCPPGQALYLGSCAEIHLQTVDEAGNLGEYASLAFDATGDPHISYYAGTGRNLRLASADDMGAWTSQAVDSLGDVGKYAIIAAPQ